MTVLALGLLLASSAPAPTLAGGPDGICSGPEAMQGLCFETGPGFVVEAITGPGGEFPVIDAAGNSVFAYQVTGPGVSGPGCSGVRDVSHGDLLIPVCASAPLVIVSSSPTIERLTNGQGDPSCGFGTGNTMADVVKWDVEVGCNESRTFSVTFAGIVPSEPTDFLLKDATNCRVNTILGPGCPMPPEVFCVGTSGCPCDNNSINGGGCLNSTGVGGRLSWSGSTSVSIDDFVLEATDLPPNQFGLFIMAQDLSPVTVGLGSGQLCLGGPQIKIIRIAPIVQTSPTGTASTAPGLVALSCSGTLGPLSLACITSGSTFNFQFYYRDGMPPAPCTEAANLTNALRVTFVN